MDGSASKLLEGYAVHRLNHATVIEYLNHQKRTLQVKLWYSSESDFACVFSLLEVIGSLEPLVSDLSSIPS